MSSAVCDGRLRRLLVRRATAAAWSMSRRADASLMVLCMSASGSSAPKAMHLFPAQRVGLGLGAGWERELRSHCNFTGSKGQSIAALGH